MRRSLVRSFGPAIFGSLLSLAAAGVAVAEDTEIENVVTDGTQITAVDVPDTKPAAKNLNTVPEDGLGLEGGKGPNSRLVRQLMAARPNEDLVICVAGCFSGRDRVVYAQPIEKPMAKSVSAAKPSKPAAGQ